MHTFTLNCLLLLVYARDNFLTFLLKRFLFVALGSDFTIRCLVLGHERLVVLLDTTQCWVGFDHGQVFTIQHLLWTLALHIDRRV